MQSAQLKSDFSLFQVFDKLRVYKSICVFCLYTVHDLGIKLLVAVHNVAYIHRLIKAIRRDSQVLTPKKNIPDNFKSDNIGIKNGYILCRVAAL